MRRVLLGVGSLWPPVWLVVFLVTVGLTLAAEPTPGEDALPVPFVLLLGLHAATIAVTITVVVVLAVDVFRNPRVAKDQQVLWLVLLIVIGTLAAPIYWWLYVR